MYLWKNNNHHRVWKFAYILKTRLMDFWVIFFMVYDIDIHQLNLEPFKKLKFLDETPLKFYFFCILFQ
jgi:hypothetical protein